ncbi:MAG: ABC transporter ATP-binding protein [Dongiaceae bacterium]
MTALVTVSDLVFDYPGQRALDGVSFAIAPGSITALVGPNGAGKSTLLRCIAALDRPAAGRIEVDGVDVEQEPRESHRRLGFLADFFGLYDELSVERCLLHHAATRRVPAGERRAAVARAAGRLGIADRLGDKAGTLSRGLRQRLAIAQAIIHEPPLVMLDEPASGLDPEARQGLSAVLLGLRQQGLTIIVSSHILAELEDYSTDMLILRDGRVVEHRPLGSDAAPDEAAEITVTLSEPDPRLLELLAAEAGVSGLQPAPEGVRFLLAGGLGRRRALLRRLVDAGLPVAGFAAARTGLQEAYLARVRDGGGR